MTQQQQQQQRALSHHDTPRDNTRRHHTESLSSFVSPTFLLRVHLCPFFLVAGYTSEVLEESFVYSAHANRSEVNLDDVKLAIQGEDGTSTSEVFFFFFFFFSSFFRLED